MMTKKIPIEAIENFDETDTHASDMKIVSLELYISGGPVHLRIGVADGPASLKVRALRQ